MNRRHQSGHIFARGGTWYVRYTAWETDEQTGERRRIQPIIRLCPVDDQHRSKGSVKELAAEKLKPINRGVRADDLAMTLRQFYDRHYEPMAKDKLRPSTWRGYRNIWKHYLADRIGDLRLREVRTVDLQAALEQIVEERRARIANQEARGKASTQQQLTTRTLQRIKAMLSAMFTYSLTQGLRDERHPVHDVTLPKGRRKSVTSFYEVSEVLRQLELLPLHLKALVATAAFAGLSKAELRGLQWQDYTGDTLRIQRSYWRTYELPTKTEERNNAVPVIKPLANLLDAHRLAAGNPTAGPIFPGPKRRRPLNLDNVARREIRDLFKLAELEWKGWHSYRRGLATTLFHLGVPLKTVQAIMRHADSRVTLEHYIHAVPAESVIAMQKLEQMCNIVQQQDVKQWAN